MRQVIPDIDDTFTKEGGPGTVAAEVFEQFRNTVQNKALYK